MAGPYFVSNRASVHGYTVVPLTLAVLLALSPRAQAQAFYPPSQGANNSANNSTATINSYRDDGDASGQQVILLTNWWNIDVTSLTGSLSLSGLPSAGAYNGVVSYLSQGTMAATPSSTAGQANGGSVTVNSSAALAASDVTGAVTAPGGILAASLGASGYIDPANPDSTTSQLDSKGVYASQAFAGTWGGPVAVNFQSPGAITIAGTGTGSDAKLLSPTLTGISARSVGGFGTSGSYVNKGLNNGSTYFFDNGGGSNSVQVTTAAGARINLAQSGAGSNAVGIWALAQGGQGGLYNGINDSGASFAIAGTGGVAGPVGVTHGGAIVVSADNGIGILAQSLGGNGANSSLPLIANTGQPGNGGAVNVEALGGSSIQMSQGGIGILALSQAGNWTPWAGSTYLPAGGQVNVAVDTGASIITGNAATGSANPFSIGVLAVSSGTPLVTGKGFIDVVNSGVAGNVAVVNNGAITSYGDLAIGIAALGVSGQPSVASASSGLNYLGNTGAGTGANVSSSVTVTHAGVIQTLGDAASGIVAISSGGGGIIKNDAPAITSADGAKWTGGTSIGANTTNIAANNGGTVIVMDTGTITTGDGLGGGNASLGIVAQSIGGSGGTAGGASNVTSVGDSAGGGGSGGETDVYLNAGAQVTTLDKNAIGVLVQSIGGGGGNGANSSNGFVAVGGAGGAGGSGQTALLNTAGATSVRTFGNYSAGVVVQSIGGGGGNGGFGDSAGAFISAATGGTGGGGGNGGRATAYNNGGGSIATQGNGAAGMTVQSIGGGGGIGGAATSFSVGVSFSGSMALGGTGGMGGWGSTATGLNQNSITTGLAPGSLDNVGFVANTGGVYGKLADGRSLGVAPLSGGSLANGVLSATLANVTLSDGTVINNAVIHGATISGTVAGSGAAFSAALQNGGIASAVALTPSSDIVNGLFVNGKVEAPPGGPNPNGADSIGMIVQSIGGGGGNGGAAIAKSLVLPLPVPGAGIKIPTLSAVFALGGKGGAGGAGGAVSASNGASIITYGDGSLGILAQSVGGGGGNGGDNTTSSTALQSSGVDIQLALGAAGAGGEGGAGGPVTAYNGPDSGQGAALIATYGQNAAGIVAQSVGGGGGNGGVGNGAVSTPNVHYPTGSSYAVTLNVGGAGAQASPGGSVTVTNRAGSTIATTGSGSQGIVAQSIGGGGGKAGGGSATGSGNTVNIDISIGGGGGGGGDGGAVTVENDGTLTTQGGDSHGVLAQAIGGGGGAGGSSDAQPSASALVSDLTSTSTPQSVGQANNLSQHIQNYLTGSYADYAGHVAVGGSGGDGGDGGVVVVTNRGGAMSGSTNPADWIAGILTQGERAYGIVAQSIGGGGGWGGAATATSRSATAAGLAANPVSQEYTATVRAGNSDGSPGSGADVTATNFGVIATRGYGAHGIVAQSIGGGGGFGADGSIDSDATMALGALGGDTTKGENTIAMQGGGITVNNDGPAGGIVTTGRDASAIVAQSIGGGGGIASSGSDAFATIGGGAAGTAAHFMALASQSTTTGTINSQGGTVTVNQSGTIVTTGDWSNGVLAQSIGGGGGYANSYSTSSVNVNLKMVLGGTFSISDPQYSQPTSNTIGTGGAVFINLADSGASITTGSQALVNGVATRTGYSAYGVLAQSIAGGGGLGVDDSASATTASGRIVLGQGVYVPSLGADYSTSDDAGLVQVTGNAAVTTYGDAAHAIVLQSIGSGGGIGGQGASLAAGSPAATNGVALALSGPGAQGSGGLVSIPGSVLVLDTSGVNAYGILAQSIGGGGGLAFAQNASLTDVAIGASTSSVAPFGPNRGNGGAVVLTLDTGSRITTGGDNAHGIVVQSIGGGGGIAGYAVGPADFDIAKQDASVSYAATGSGGVVALTVDADIRTSGASANGIVAQSIGGGGGLVAKGGAIAAGQTGSSLSAVGSTVAIAQTGSIITTGANATGIFAQSTGHASSGSAAGGAVTVAINGLVSGGSGNGYGVWVDGGAGNALTVNSGGLLTSLSGNAINYTGKAALGVTNYGGVAGSVQLGGGGVFTNKGTYYVNGLSLDALPGNVDNQGTLGYSPSYRGGPDSLTAALTGAAPVLYQVDTGSTFSILAPNTYTGGTILAGGRVLADNDTAFGVGAVRVVNPLAWVGTTGAARKIDFANDFALDQTLTISTAGPNLVMSGVISGAGGLTKTGGGSLTLGNNNTYTGATEVDQGSLSAGAPRALSNATLRVGDGATLDLGGFAHRFSGIFGSGVVTSLASKADLTVGDGHGLLSRFDGKIDSGIGALIVDGGKLILTAANTYLGDTTLRGNAPGLIVGDDHALGDGALIVDGTNATLGTLRGARGGSPVTLANRNIDLRQSLTIATGGVDSPDLALSGTITGAGNLTKTGTGALTLSGDNRPAMQGYTGATLLQGGTLKAGSADSFSARSAVVISPGATLDVGGYASTIGSLAGAGTVTNSADNVVALSVGADNTDTRYSGSIEPDGDVGLNKIGSGALVLAHANTYGGGTRLSQGTLAAANAGALGKGDVINVAGILTTAEANRAINIGGNYVQQAGGTLALNINDLVSAFDSVHVAGSATLDGSLRLKLAGRFAPGAGVGLRALQFDGGVTGQFANVGTSLPSLLASVQGSTITLRQGAFAALGNGLFSANALAIARHIDANDQGPMRTGFANVIAELNNLSVQPGALANAFSQLSPERFGNFVQSTIVNNASFQTQQFDGYIQSRRAGDGAFVGGNGGIDISRLNMVDPTVPGGLAQIYNSAPAGRPAQAGAGPASPGDGYLAADGAKPWHVYVQGNVVLAKDKPGGGIPKADATTKMVQAGADYLITPHLLAGGYFGYAHSTSWLDGQGSRGTLDSYAPSIYASYADGGWYANALGSYGFNKMRDDRRLAFGAFNATAQGRPSGDQQTANLDGGYDFYRQNWTFGPTAGVQYTRFTVKGYDENGANGANLATAKLKSDSLRGRLGGRVAYAFQSGATTLNTHMDVSWQHEFRQQGLDITSRFADTGADSFTVRTPNASRNAAVIGLGVDAKVGKQSTVFLQYTTLAGQSNYFGQSIQAGLRVGF